MTTLAEKVRIDRDAKNRERTSRKVQRLRKRLGMSQKQLANRVGVGWRTVQRWESGESLPRPIAKRVLDDLATAK